MELFCTEKCKTCPKSNMLLIEIHEPSSLQRGPDTVFICCSWFLCLGKCKPANSELNPQVQPLHAISTEQHTTCGHGRPITPIELADSIPASRNNLLSHAPTTIRFGKQQVRSINHVRTDALSLVPLPREGPYSRLILLALLPGFPSVALPSRKTPPLLH